MEWDAAREAGIRDMLEEATLHWLVFYNEDDNDDLYHPSLHTCILS